jgi:hypothetical protein
MTADGGRTLAHNVNHRTGAPGGLRHTNSALLVRALSHLWRRERGTVAGVSGATDSGVVGLLDHRLYSTQGNEEHVHVNARVEVQVPAGLGEENRLRRAKHTHVLVEWHDGRTRQHAAGSTAQQVNASFSRGPHICCDVRHRRLGR